MKTKICALMGKAGSGKDTIMKKIIHNSSQFYPIVSCTTRPRRDYEKENVDYIFISNDEFEQLKTQNQLLEDTEFNGWYYGTPMSSCSKSKINIGVFNPAGVRKLLQNEQLDVYIYYIIASDKYRIMRQISREANPNINEIFRRYKTDEEDFASLSDIPYTLLINNTEKELQQAIQTIMDDFN